MADVKWVKLYVDMFDNRKIKMLKNMPEGKSILLIWIQLIVLAGQINDNGAIYFTKEIPYTDEMLAVAFDEKLEIVRMSLQMFKKFQMIDILEDVIYLSNWEKYQSSEKLLQIQEQNRERVARFRQKQKQLASNVTVTLQDTLRNGIEQDKEIEQELEKEKKENSKTTSLSVQTDIEAIKTYWNTYSFLDDITAITELRAKTLKARIKEYGLDAIYKAIDNVGKSAFLRGQNDRGWMADFNWVFKPNNFIKVLEGSYNKESKKSSDKTTEERAEQAMKELQNMPIFKNDKVVF